MPSADDLSEMFGPWSHPEAWAPQEWSPADDCWWFWCDFILVFSGLAACFGYQVMLRSPLDPFGSHQVDVRRQDGRFGANHPGRCPPPVLPHVLSLRRWTADAPSAAPPPSGEAPRQVMDGVMIQFLAEIHPFSSSFTPFSFNPPPPSGFFSPHSGLLTHICWLAERAGMFTRVIFRIPLAPSSVFVFLSSSVENQSR